MMDTIGTLMLETGHGSSLCSFEMDKYESVFQLTYKQMLTFFNLVAQ